ncbi:MAG: hypothetical protein Q8S01_14645 [Ignavibacteria bacterium]|nr:hypothetical protein [Ignavibacteria bacterium]
MMRSQKINDPILIKKAEYHSFLLRIWRTQEQGGNNWFFSLENPITSELIGFQSLLSLTSYLTQVIEKAQVKSKIIEEKDNEKKII